MYLGIDIGGTKTLVASIDNEGTMTEHFKIKTPHQYETFIEELQNIVAKMTTKKFKAVGVGLPATELNREKGLAVSFGNLPWRNISIRDDLVGLLHLPVVVENDAKLAGLSEATLLKNHHKVLYITISTGIGTALIVDKVIDTSLGDGGGRTLMVEYEGKVVPWESFASGSAIVERFGKRAEDIHDSRTWAIIGNNIALGLIDVIAMTEPDIIVIGGGVGAYLARFIDPLTEALKRYDNPLLPLPPIKEAKRPEKAVVYGCYALAKATYG
ncbi:MAG TPA: ROK family protein [Candidatus Saccharimonadales bacterium]|nr:ROK family protein [Candidatus Saccharimonadales bacterium]